MKPSRLFPQFRLRALVLAIVFIALVLAVGVLTIENMRLRRNLVAEQRRRAADQVKAGMDYLLARANLAAALYERGVAQSRDGTATNPVKSAQKGSSTQEPEASSSSSPPL
jgi:hypothetical protein